MRCGGNNYEILCARLGEVLGRRVVVRGWRVIGGGCIHNAGRLDTDAGSFFVKFNKHNCLPQFEAEARALQAIADTDTVRVPRVLFAFGDGGRACLVLEYLHLGAPEAKTYEMLGRQLAALHSVRTGGGFGWETDNFIGSTPQVNTPCRDWAEFFRERRLRHLLELLSRQGTRFKNAGLLLGRVEAFLHGVEVRPSLLHGDLWGGNTGCLADGTAVIFDPATYRGHDETDLAMTELFGAFPESFYAAYHELRPRRPGYTEYRRDLYNLYHILNHALLFGGGYTEQARAIIDRLATCKM